MDKLLAFLTPRNVLLLLLLAALVALAGALTAQYIFGLRPCILCIYQRFPPAVIAALAVIGLLLRQPGARRAIVALCAIAFAVELGIAAYHVGVEQHWWEGTSACSGGTTTPTSMADLRAALSQPDVARCDEPAWSLFGISFAGYNVLYSLGLAVLAALAAFRAEIWRPRR